MSLERLFSKIGGYNKAFDRKKLEAAFAIVGDFSMVLDVVDILLPLKPDDDTVAAVVLYELYVTGHVGDDKIRQEFGIYVLDILRSLRKLAGLSYAHNDASAQIEVLRKMFLALAKDLRVILIWLAFRLHRMKNLDDLTDEAARLQVARETMNLYAPIASRLGLYRLKVQLEDLAFKHLNPKEYHDVNEQINKMGKKRKYAISHMRDTLKDFLRERGVVAEVDGRLKSVYSVYLKLKRKALNSVADLYDFFAIRVVLPVLGGESEGAITDRLYMVLGMIHSEWKPLSNRFKDYVAVPKPNGYRSLHTVVLGLAPKEINEPVEIQIRDARMHDEAEYGVASHWLYKSSGDFVQSEVIDSHSEWLQGLQKIQEFFKADFDVTKNLELDIFKDSIFALTPRGEVKDLPYGASPIDFAYAVHTDVGNRCVLAKVNGVAVPLDSELKNGDVVEIVTKKEAGPKLKWLSIVKSNMAKNKIKVWFSGLNKESNVKEGRRLINSQLERLHKPLLDHGLSILKEYCGAQLNFGQREHLVEEVGKGSQTASDVVRKVFPYEKNLVEDQDISFLPVQKQSNADDSTVIVGGESGLPMKFASCCNPQKPEPIVAYAKRGQQLTIHKFDCKLLAKLNEARHLNAAWKGVVEERVQGRLRVGIRLRVASRVGLIRDVASIITKFGINIVDVRIESAGVGTHYECFLLDLGSLDQFDMLLDKLEDVEGVLKASKYSVSK